MLIVLVFGVLVAPAAFGHGVVDLVGQLAEGVTCGDPKRKPWQRSRRTAAL
ncbi:hypothetical protein ACWGDT_16060 [Streptomyces avermitilis]